MANLWVGLGQVAQLRHGLLCQQHQSPRGKQVAETDRVWDIPCEINQKFVKITMTLSDFFEILYMGSFH